MAVVQLDHPGKWLVRHDVEEGRAALNFSEWDAYTESQKAHEFEEIAEMVGEGEMPLRTYTLLHKDAVLSQEEASRLTDWARAQGPQTGSPRGSGRPD